eukprot:1064736-Amphidinium_carterae.1
MACFEAAVQLHMQEANQERFAARQANNATKMRLHAHQTDDAPESANFAAMPLIDFHSSRTPRDSMEANAVVQKARFCNDAATRLQ